MTGRHAHIPRRIRPHSLRQTAIINALDACDPFRDGPVLARHGDPRNAAVATTA